MTLVRDLSPPPEDFRHFEDHIIASWLLDTRPGSRERAAFMEVVRLRNIVKKQGIRIRELEGLTTK